MPGTKNQTFRIKIIDDLLSRKKWVKTSEIQRVIQDKFSEYVSERTIQKDISDMKNDTRLEYFAPIGYNKSRGAFTYEDENFTIKNFSLKPHEITALQFYAECLQVFSGYKLFDSFTSGIQKVISGVQLRNKLKPTSNPKTIIQTDTLITPKGHRFIEDLVYAVDNKLKVEITYHPYGVKKSYTRFLFPLFLKEYKNRWYLIATRLDTDELRTYALDRIKSMNVTEEEVQKNINFNPEDFFKYSFGITTPDAPIEKLVLRFSKSESPYIKSLPIHPSQRIIKETTRSTTVTIKVILSYEVYEFLMGKLPDVQVISPFYVRDEVSKRIKKAAFLYK